jgi:hypothetical protein
MSSIGSSSRQHPWPARLDVLYRFDTHRGDQYNDATLWNYDPTAEEYYYDFGCTIVSTGVKIPALLTKTKQADKETASASRVSARHRYTDLDAWRHAYDILDWHNPCGQQVVVPIAPYNPRNTDDPKDIEYRIEDRIEEHSEDVQMNQSSLDETYNNRTDVERTNDAVKDCGLGHRRAQGRVHARTQVPCAVSPTRRCNHPTTSGEIIPVAKS